MLLSTCRGSFLALGKKMKSVTLKRIATFVIGAMLIQSSGGCGLPSVQSYALRPTATAARPELLGFTSAVQEKTEHDRLWWKDPLKTHLIESTPLYALRDETKPDQGIGKYTHAVPFAQDELVPAGVNAELWVPHMSILDESAYSPVCRYAANEDYVDLTVFSEVVSDQELMQQLFANLVILRNGSLRSYT